MSSPAAPVDIHRYPVVGGAAAWCLGLVTIYVAAGALVFRGVEAAGVVAALGWVVHRLSRSVVVEISPTGLTHGVLVMGPFHVWTTIIPWRSVMEVDTGWARPGDDSALRTAVRDGEGRAIGLSTAMGLAAYWACLAEVVRRAPAAARVGLTDGVLAGGPPGRRDLVAAGRVAAALALVLLAFVAVHYLWAQGQSSLARDLDRASPVAEPRR